MSSPGGGDQGGSNGYQQGGAGGGQPGASSASNQDMTMTYTTAITTSNATPTSATTLSPTSSTTADSTPETHSDTTRNIIIGAAIGGTVVLLLLIALLTCCINRRHKRAVKAKKKKSGEEMQISAPMGGGRVVSYSELNRQFAGVPYGHAQNSNPHSLPDSGYGHSETNVMRGAVVRSPSFSSQITRESGRDQVMVAGYREEEDRGYSDRNRQDMYGNPTSNLPPTYEESQSDVLSTRVLTPQYPQPSAFLNQNGNVPNSATQAGFLSPQHTGRELNASESPYSSQIFSPDSLRTSFFIEGYGYDATADNNDIPYLHQNLGLQAQNQPYSYNYDEARRSSIPIPESLNLRRNNTDDIVSPLSPLEPPPTLGDIRAATDSLESLVRGPGGLLARSGTVSTVSSFGEERGRVSGVSEGELRDELRPMREFRREDTGGGEDGGWV